MNFITILIYSLLFHFPFMSFKKADTRVFELRIYHCNEGKLNDLIARFQNHTTKIFERHGMQNIGYWLPTATDNNSMYYILAYPDLASREASWKAFGSDEEWQKVRTESEMNGKIVNKVESIYLNATDFSPAIKKSIKNPERIFELRTYTCYPGRITALETRFRDHTVKLFKQHGMTNVAYWKTIEKDAANTPKLVYILAHKSEAAAKKSFDDFRVDPKWVAARDKSESNGKIVEKVESVFMKPLPFSSIR